MTLFLLILACLIVVATTVVLTTMLYHAIRFVPYVPTSNDVSKMMVEAAELKDGQTVYDLGCGDGRLLIHASKQHQVKAIGIEGSWMVYLLAMLHRWIRQSKHILKYGDFFQMDFKDADVIFCYLFPRVMNKLAPVFVRDLKPGAKIVSHSFPIAGWKPVKTIQTRKDKPHNFLLYIYEMPTSHA